ncbi:unnamed protein product, partial [Urochloa humidicola]
PSDLHTRRRRTHLGLSQAICIAAGEPLPVVRRARRPAGVVALPLSTLGHLSPGRRPATRSPRRPGRPHCAPPSPSWCSAVGAAVVPASFAAASVVLASSTAVVPASSSAASAADSNDAGSRCQQLRMVLKRLMSCCCCCCSAKKDEAREVGPQALNLKLRFAEMDVLLKNLEIVDMEPICASTTEYPCSAIIHDASPNRIVFTKEVVVEVFLHKRNAFWTFF